MSEADRARWNEKYLAQGAVAPPSSFLVSLDSLLPREGRALDVAGGSGRNALWLAERGLDVTMADVSDEALRRADAEATARGLRLNTLRLDVDAEPLPEGPWGVVTCFYFLHRPLFAEVPLVLAGSGLFVFAHPTVENLSRHPKPSRHHLLDAGEAQALFAAQAELEILRFTEDWTEDGHHEARAVARRRA